MNNLWIDDIRLPPEGYVWAKTSSEAISILSERTEKFDHISFDHDLGGEKDDSGEYDSSRTVVLWLCENDSHWPRFASVHSMNPIGREWLTGMIKRYGNGCKVI